MCRCEMNNTKSRAFLYIPKTNWRIMVDDLISNRNTKLKIPRYNINKKFNVYVKGKYKNNMYDN